MMPIEFEAKFFVDFDEIKETIKKMGGVRVRGRGFMRRFVFGIPGQTEQWIRVRDEGDYIALSLKSFDADAERAIESVRELEVKVSDFGIMVQMLELLGYAKSLYMENYREIWKLKDSLVMFDELPGIEPFIEIEGPSKISVENVAALLGLDMDKAMYGSNWLLYEKKYGITKEQFNALKELTFIKHPGLWKK